MGILTGLGTIFQSRLLTLQLIGTIVILFVPLDYLIDQPINIVILVAELFATLLNSILKQGIQVIFVLLTVPLVLIDWIGGAIVGMINNGIIDPLNSANVFDFATGKIDKLHWNKISDDFSYNVSWNEVKFPRVDIFENKSIFQLIWEAFWGETSIFSKPDWVD